MNNKDCLLGFEEIKTEITYSRYLEVDAFYINPGENWAILGKNGSGKSFLGKLISGDIEINKGNTISNLSGKPPFISFEKQIKIIEKELKNDDSEFLGYIDPGQSAYEFITYGIGDSDLFNKLADKLNIRHIFDTGIKYLSTGEIRKVLVCRAFLNTDKLVVLDEPFDGLDVSSRKIMKDLLVDVSKEGIQLVLILNRPEEIIDTISHVAVMDDCRLARCGEKEEILKKPVFDYPELNFDGKIPGLEGKSKAQGIELVNMKNVNLSYYEKKVLQNVSWTVKKGEHWKIVGPNGCGKSTLLSLINADNPKAYGNDITVMGIKKGSGETIWDIKEKIGFVSSALQVSYRVPISAFQVIISGFFDSIGIYRLYNKIQKDIAFKWLEILNLEKKADTSFRALSYGEQRLLLIARAMVKRPELLILDEPCQGLDSGNIKIILSLIDYIADYSDSTVLYVSHHDEDVIPAIKRKLEFVKAENAFTVQIYE